MLEDKLNDMPYDFDIKKIKRTQTTMSSREAHAHPFHEIFYLSSGDCTTVINHNVYKFHTGDVVIVPAGTMHMTNYDGDGIHERVVISFRDNLIDWIADVIGQDVVDECMRPGVIPIPERRRDYVVAIIDKLLFEKSTPDPISPGFIRAGIVELILFLFRCRKYEANVIKEIDADNSTIQEIVTYIYHNYNESISLDDMAQRFNLSRSYLSKKFKTSTGSGFKEYVINVRIQNACALLLNTNKTITEIAFECGFNDSNYFGDAFKRVKGVSPHKYRKNTELV